MPKITLTPFLLHGIYQIKISFNPNLKVKAYIEKFEAIQWSQTHDAFYLCFSKKESNRLFVYLRKQNYYVDYEALKTIEAQASINKPKTSFELLNLKNQNLIEQYKK